MFCQYIYIYEKEGPEKIECINEGIEKNEKIKRTF